MEKNDEYPFRPPHNNFFFLIELKLYAPKLLARQPMIILLGFCEVFDKFVFHRYDMWRYRYIIILFENYSGCQYSWWKLREREQNIYIYHVGSVVASVCKQCWWPRILHCTRTTVVYTVYWHRQRFWAMLSHTAFDTVWNSVTWRLLDDGSSEWTECCA